MHRVPALCPSTSTGNIIAPSFLASRAVLVLGFVAILESWRDHRQLMTSVAVSNKNSNFLPVVTRHARENGTKTGASSWGIPMPISELTGGNQPLPTDCVFPYVPVADIIATTTDNDNDNHNGNSSHTKDLIPSKIPRQIHLAWISPNEQARDRMRKQRHGRCLHYLQAETLQKWHQALPHYDIYFHDDNAVDRLLAQEHWPEFPHLNNVLQCAQMRGALLVDIWRVLVLYKYG